MDLSLCYANGGGIETGVTELVLDRATKGLDLQTGDPDQRVFEYTSVVACPQNSPNAGGPVVMCMGASQACAGNTPQQGQGPMVRLFRRELDANGVATTGWQLLGTTCQVTLVPGKPVLDLPPILAAFHNTAWAKPIVHTQPEGNVTLVTLNTYFEVRWGTEGYQPGEIDSTTLLSSQVRIRPTLQSYTYVFGDGNSSEPTSSAGGTYPDGDITHAYAKAGTYISHIDITYGGEYSIAGGPWRRIPDTVTVTGQSQPVTVKTAHARLVIK
ncbi:MAG: hypothetical protein QOF35_2076 [Actinomycetota bacterium]|nr:hypothetical protein [Actinomycetota bacterium]